MSAIRIVLKKELLEILRDRRTLIAIALATLATPAVLFVISQVSAKTATQAYTIGYSGQIPAGRPPATRHQRRTQTLSTARSRPPFARQPS